MKVKRVQQAETELRARLNLAGIESPSLEAQLLLAMCIRGSRLDILRDPQRKLTQDEMIHLEELASAREMRIPLARLRGTQEFYGLTFKVSAETLIPRPETEMLVEIAIEKLSSKQTAILADIGTGSGCILIASLTHLPNVQGVAVEISSDALQTAKRNARLHGVEDRIVYRLSSMLQSFENSSLDMIVSNPPYIPEHDIETLEPEVRLYDPHRALSGGVDGFDFHRELVREASRCLKPDGWLALEMGIGQANGLLTLLRDQGFTQVKTLSDLAGIERVAVGQSCIH